MRSVDRFMIVVSVVFVLPLWIFVFYGYYLKQLDLGWVLLFVFFGCLAFYVIGKDYIWNRRNDLLMGEFSFDCERITFHCPSHSTVFQYSECVEIGLTGAFVTNPLSVLPQRAFFVYLSKRKLTDNQRFSLVRFHRIISYKKRREWDDIPVFEKEYVLFQYNPEVFKEFVKCVPEQYRDALLADEKKLLLSRLEEYINRNDIASNENKNLVLEHDEVKSIVWEDNKKAKTIKSSKEKKAVRYNKTNSYKASRFLTGPKVARIMFLMLWCFGLMVDYLFPPKVVYPETLFGSTLKTTTIVWCWYSFVLLVWRKLMQPLYSKVSFSTEGIAYKMPFRTIGISFEECRSIRIIKWKGKLDSAYFICLARNDLPNGDDSFLFKRWGWIARRKGMPVYKKDFFLFEYYMTEFDGPVIFREFLKCVPDCYKEQLLLDEKEIIPYKEKNKWSTVKK